LLTVMEKYPVIITLGAALLGFVAGEMLVSDRALAPFFASVGTASTTIVEVAGAVGVVLVGRWLAGRKGKAAGHSAGADPA
jgi:predicted tellurium resistance membrane protein TerC